MQRLQDSACRNSKYLTFDKTKKKAKINNKLYLFKMQKFMCFRFDVDTHLCMSKGVPNLIQLSRDLEVKFTFIINMGYAFDYFISLKKILSRMQLKTREPNGAISFSNSKKFGLFHTLIAGMNPKVGSGYQNIINLLSEEGHEIGLHGGLNHATWETYAHQWSHQKVVNEIQSSLALMTQCKIPAPQIFASPSWNSPKQIGLVLQSLGFKFIADEHSSISDKLYSYNESSIISIPTNILGFNSHVGYIENLRSRKYSSRDIINNFSNQLDSIEKFAVVYDHPYYAGIYEKDIIINMVDIAKKKGFEVTTISEMAKKVS